MSRVPDVLKTKEGLWPQIILKSLAARTHLGGTSLDF